MPSFPSSISIGVAGLGNRAGMFLIAALQEHSGLRIVGYADPLADNSGVQAVKKRGISVGKHYAEVSALLKAEKPDLLLVGSPNHLHVEHIRAGLEAGCTVLTEKPVAITPEQSYEIGRLVAQYGDDRLLVTGLVLRSNPLARIVTELVKSGRLGRLISMEANEHLGVEHGAYLMRDWRRKQAWTGGYLLEKCSHDFDVYQSLIGADAARVASFGARSIFTPENAALAAKPEPDGRKPYHDWQTNWSAGGKVFDSDADVCDHQTAIVEYANGVRLAFHSNTHSTIVQRRWMIFGTEGVLESDVESDHLRLRSIRSRAAEVFEIPDVIGHHRGSDRGMAQDLARFLRGQSKFHVSTRDALAAGLTCMAIDQARTTGTVVDARPMMAKLDASFAKAAKA